MLKPLTILLSYAKPMGAPHFQEQTEIMADENGSMQRRLENARKFFQMLRGCTEDEDTTTTSKLEQAISSINQALDALASKESSSEGSFV